MSHNYPSCCSWCWRPLPRFLSWRFPTLFRPHLSTGLSLNSHLTRVWWVSVWPNETREPGSLSWASKGSRFHNNPVPLVDSSGEKYHPDTRATRVPKSLLWMPRATMWTLWRTSVFRSLGGGRKGAWGKGWWCPAEPPTTTIPTQKVSWIGKNQNKRGP